MRGVFQDQSGLFSYIALEERVPADHPLRKIRELVRAVLIDMNRTFARLYADEGRPSIPPEQLLSALLLQAFYGIRSRGPGAGAAQPGVPRGLRWGAGLNQAAAGRAYRGLRGFLQRTEVIMEEVVSSPPARPS